MQTTFWSPAASSNNLAVCNVSRCAYPSSEMYDPDEETERALRSTVPAIAPRPVILEGVPPFDQKRVVVWYQKNCVACQSSKPVFTALRQLGAASNPPFTVHEVEATEENLKRFPHVRVVPLYDVVEPTAPTSVPGPYGPRTRYTSVKNEMAALRTEFPGLVVPTATTAPAPAPAPALAPAPAPVPVVPVPVPAP